MEFATILKELRLARKLSQVELAAQTGIGASTIASYELGKRQPRKEQLEALCDFFNVDEAYIRGLDNKSTYLIDPMDMVLLKAFEERPELRMLFSVAQGCTAEEIENTVKIIEAIRK